MCSLSMLQCCLYCECNVSANRTQSDENWLSKAMLRCSLTSRMQCQCQPNAELENLFSKVLLRCSLTSRMQRYNMHNPKSKFFRCLISHLESFSDLRMCIQPFIYGHFGAFFILEKKWNRDIIFYLLTIIKTYETVTFCLTQIPQSPHLFSTEPTKRFTTMLQKRKLRKYKSVSLQ